MSVVSPSVVARAIATFGPSSGAMTMAPITTAMSFRIRPTAATIDDSTVSPA